MADETDGEPGDVEASDPDTGARATSVTDVNEESGRRAQILMDLVLGTSEPDYRPTLKELQARVGTELGNYALRELLGAGGMGAVYRAENITTKTPVALKLLIDPRGKARFREEIATKQRLDHAHIVRVLHVDPELRFFTMPLMTSKTLADRIGQYAGHPLGAAQLVMVLADAVHYFHTHGIIHRDLKPSNILFNERGEPFVSDFGICKRDERWLSAHGLTTPGVFVGTFPYASPEQVATDGDITILTDVYNLGFILYELVAGSVPIACSEKDRAKILTQEPPSLDSFGVRIDRDLEIIILRCLRKDPLDRYPSAKALAEDLQRYLENRPIEARRVGWLERLGLVARRRPAAFVVGAALLAVLAVQPLAALVSGAREDRRKDELSLHAEARPFAISTYFQLMLYANPLVQLSERPALRTMLVQHDKQKAQELLDAEATRLVEQGLASEINLFLVDDNGSAVARTPAREPSQPLRAGEFSSRDYVEGALARHGRGMDAVHLSKAFASRFDERKKLALSIAIRDAQDRPLGVLAMYWASAPQLGMLQELSNDRRTFALAVEAEADLREPHGGAAHQPPYLVILHPKYEKAAVVEPGFVHSTEIGKVGGRDERQPELRFDGQAMGIERKPAYDEHYRDSVAPGSEESVASFMPVGNTQLIAVVSKPRDDSSKRLSTLELHAKWSLAAGGIGLAVAAIVVLRTRRRRARLTPP